MALLKDGFSSIPSNRQLFSSAGGFLGSPLCQLGTSPHFIVCNTRSSEVSTVSPGRSKLLSVVAFWMCLCWLESKTGLYVWPTEDQQAWITKLIFLLSANVDRHLGILGNTRGYDNLSRQPRYKHILSFLPSEGKDWKKPLGFTEGVFLAAIRLQVTMTYM